MPDIRDFMVPRIDTYTRITDSSEKKKFEYLINIFTSKRMIKFSVWWDSKKIHVSLLVSRFGATYTSKWFEPASFQFQWKIPYTSISLDQSGHFNFTTKKKTRILLLPKKAGTLGRLQFRAVRDPQYDAMILVINPAILMKNNQGGSFGSLVVYALSIFSYRTCRTTYSHTLLPSSREQFEKLKMTALKT